MLNVGAKHSLVSVVDFDAYEQAANLKLSEFERRLWGELDQSQMNQYAGYMTEINSVRHELSSLQG